MGATRTMVRNDDLMRLVRLYREGLARIDVAELADPRTHRFYHGYLGGLRDAALVLFGEAAWDKANAEDSNRVGIFALEEQAKAEGPDRLLAFIERARS